MTRWVSFALGNPVKYNDPSGHCADVATTPVCAALAPAGPVGWAIIGVLIVVDVALIAVTIDAYITPPKTETTNANLSDAVNTTSATVAEADALLMKGEYIPDLLSGDAERAAYCEAVHLYKGRVWHLPKGAELPKDILDNIAELIKKEKKPIEAAEGAPEPPEGESKSHKNQNQNKWK